jgi:hypothetical protein
MRLGGSIVDNRITPCGYRRHDRILRRSDAGFIHNHLAAGKLRGAKFKDPVIGYLYTQRPLSQDMGIHSAAADYIPARRGQAQAIFTGYHGARQKDRSPDPAT